MFLHHFDFRLDFPHSVTSTEEQASLRLQGYYMVETESSSITLLAVFCSLFNWYLSSSHTHMELLFDYFSGVIWRGNWKV